MSYIDKNEDYPFLHSDNNEEFVEKIQTNYYIGNNDGIYNEKIKKAVTDFQLDNDIYSNGNMNIDTWNKITENNLNILNNINGRVLSNVPVGQRPTLRQGDTGEWVEELQRELTQLTFYSGPINGVFDAQTNTAVRAFQSNNKLSVDGVVGRNTWSALIFLYAPLAICPGSGLLPTPFKGIVIDAGHGGTDPGATGNGIIEKDLTLAISMYQNDRFYELNIPHFMTRTSDITLNPADRVAKIKSGFGDEKGVILISNHINAGGGEDKNVVKLKEYDIVCI